MTHPLFQQTRIALSTGVELDVVIEGPQDGAPILFLHGFPESHRTWRHQIAHFADRYRCIVPDQRGYVDSSKPQEKDAYKTHNLVGDVFALADALDIDRFTLVGHDWGGAAAWAAALTRPERIERLIIANAPHPYTYQKALFDDLEQRAAAQYITAFRGSGFEDYIERKGWDAYFAENFSSAVEGGVPKEERAIYLQQWQIPGAFHAMLAWYRDSAIIIPPMPDSGEPQPERPAYLERPFSMLKMPVLLIWAMDDKALRPSLLDGLDAVVDDLTLVKIPGGHFVTWENHAAVNAAMEAWL